VTQRETPRALVVVSAYNQLPYLRRVVAGYLRQSCTDFQLVIADDGSSDGTGAFLEARAVDLEARGIGLLHVWHEDVGFRKTKILNEAVRRSPEAPLLIFSDGDCIPPRHFVERHLAAHEDRSFHVGGAYRLDRATSEGIDEEAVETGSFEACRLPENEKELRKKARQSRWGTRFGRRNRPKILGLNMAFDRALFLALNGFDEDFADWGVGEDSDMRDRAMRLRPRPRVKVLYTQNDVYHLWHPVSKDLSASRARRAEERPLRCVHGFLDER
jgi:glycosyltransferase involved in cell wall biosynthesis